MALVIVTPALGPSLGTAPAGDVDVQVAVLVEVRRDVQRVGVGADIRQRGLRRFLHHVAELPGELQSLAARHPRGLDEDHVAPHRGPDEARHDARLLGPLGHLLVLEARGAEVLLDLRAVNRPEASVRPSANSRVALRQTAAISRSRDRTPASRV